MNCPFKNNHRLKKIPCSWYTPPGHPNVRLCETCGQHYRVDKVVQEEYREESFLTFFLIIFIAVILSTVTMFLNSENPEPDNTQAEQVQPYNSRLSN
jgi:hypothetical protein